MVFIHSINISGQDGVFDGKLSISVKSKNQLTKLIENIKKLDASILRCPKIEIILELNALIELLILNFII